MVKYVYDQKYRKVVESTFPSAIFFIILLGLYNVLTTNNLLIGRLFAIASIFILILGPVLLASFKRKIGIELTPESILLHLYNSKKGIEDLIIPLDSLDSYTISYPKSNAYSIKFILTNHTTYTFYITDKNNSEEREKLVSIVRGIHDIISGYNQKVLNTDSKIKRKYSFLASKNGLIFIIILSLIGFSGVAIAAMKASVTVVSLPLFFGFIFIALSQRKKELNDYPRSI